MLLNTPLVKTLITKALISKTLLSILIASQLILSGCIGQPIQVSAAQIRIFESAPKNCQFLGSVTGTQGNFLTGIVTKDEELISSAFNDIRNQADLLKANSLQITSTKPDRKTGLNSYTYYANAYY